MTVETRGLGVDRHFCLNRILDGTQDFRWCLRENGWFSGVLKGNLVHLRQRSDDTLEYRAKENLDTLLCSYFRLDDDLDGIHRKLKQIREMAALVEQYPYLRVLRQPDPWETTVAYICSPNNNVERIGAMVKKIAKVGEALELDGDRRPVFPTPCEVRKVGEDRIKKLLGELRPLPALPARIVCAAERICGDKLNLGNLAKPSTTYWEAKLQLLACPGIGDKIADCIALFALDKGQAFPVDTNIRRAVNDRFFPNLEMSDKHDAVIAQWAQDTFGKHAGHASQLLFLEGRESR